MFTVRKKRKRNAGAQRLHQLQSRAVIKATVAMATHGRKSPVLSRQMRLSADRVFLQWASIAPEQRTRIRAVSRKGSL